MPNLLECARVHATEGEIVAAMQDRVGQLHREPGVQTRHGEHLRDAHELHARAALWLAGRRLVRVDRLPARPGHEPGHAAAQPRLDRLAVGRRLVQPARVQVLDAAARRCRWRPSCSCRSRRTGPRLIQPTAYSPGSGVAVVVGHAAAVVADQAAALVERHAGQRAAAVADRAQHQAAVDDLLLAGGDGAQRRRGVRLDAGCAPRAAPLTAPSSPSPRISTRRAQEAQLDPVRLARCGSRCAYSLQDVDVAARGRVGLVARASAAECSSSSTSAGSTMTSARFSSPSSRSSGFVNAACAGPRRPRMTTSLDLRLRRTPSIAWSAVSVAASSSGSSTSMRATSIATLPLPITTARLAATGRTRGRRSRGGRCTRRRTRSRRCEPRAVLARDPEPVVVARADRVDDRVVALEQLPALDVGAELDAAEEAEARVLRGLLVDARDRLDLRVVGRDAGAHEPERRRQRVVEVDLEAAAFSSARRRRSRRAGADHGTCTRASVIPDQRDRAARGRCPRRPRRTRPGPAGTSIA